MLIEGAINKQHAGALNHVEAASRARRLLSLAQLYCAGIGGVHRGGESSMDISADLTELGRTPIAVVCAGVKSILDIPRTLEVDTEFLQERTDRRPAFSEFPIWTM